MTTNMEDYFTDCREFRNEHKNIIDGQFENDLLNKSFSIEVIFFDKDTLRDGIKLWRTIVNRSGPRPNKVYD